MSMEKKFGKVLARLRQEKGYSQEAFGFECNLHRTYISQLERGLKSPTIRTLFQLSKILGIKPSKIIQETEG